MELNSLLNIAKFIKQQKEISFWNLMERFSLKPLTKYVYSCVYVHPCFFKSFLIVLIFLFTYMFVYYTFIN